MNILFFTHDLDQGGASRSLSILIRELSSRHSITLVSLNPPHPDRKMHEFYRNLGIPVYVGSWGWLPVSYDACDVNAQAQANVIELCRETMLPAFIELAQKADAVCFNGYPTSSLAQYLPESVPKYMIAREVVREESSDVAETYAMLRKHLRHTVAIVPFISAQLTKWGLPNTVVFNATRQTPMLHPMPEGDEVHFGVFGQILPAKGQKVLVRGCAMELDTLRKHRVKVHIYGGDPMTARHEEEIKAAIATHGMGDVVFMEGWSNTVETDMVSMHCIVRPDLTGSPWGRDIIEALSMARPVLASGDDDVFIKTGKNGWLVPANNPQILGRMMGHLAKDRKIFQQYSENAYTFAMENFNPDTNAKRIEKILSGHNN